MMESPRSGFIFTDRFLFGIILCLYIAFTFASIVLTPLGEGPDEFAHYDVALYISTEKSLPPPRFDEALPAQSFQPPLYYVLCSFLFITNDNTRPAIGGNPDWDWSKPVATFLPLPEHSFPWKGGVLHWHLCRLFSMICGLATVVLVLKIARFLLSPIAAVAATSMVAFNPQFVYMHSIISNDALAITLATAIVYIALRLLESPTSFNWFLAGLLTGLAAITKLSAIPVSAALMVPFLLMYRRGIDIRGMLLRGTLSAFPFLLLFGSLVFRNMSVNGSPTGLGGANPANLWQDPLRPWELLPYIPAMLVGLFKSFWGMYGWMNIPLWRTMYLLILAVCLLSTIGLLRLGFAKGFETLRNPRVLVLLTASTAMIAAFYLISLKINESGWQGRLIMPTISSLAIICYTGIRAMFPQHAWLNYVYIVMWFVILLIAFFGVYLPVYCFVEYAEPVQVLRN